MRKKGAKKTRDEYARRNPPTATGKKLITNGGNLGSMLKLNEGKYKVTRFARDKNALYLRKSTSSFLTTQLKDSYTVAAAAIYAAHDFAAATAASSVIAA